MIIFLYGPDTFRSRQKLKEIKEKFLREVDASGMNMQILDGKTVELETLESSLSTLPFLAKKRMVILENLLPNKLHSKNTKRITELFEKKSTKDTIIVFWEGEISEEKLKKNALYQYLKKQKYQYGFLLLAPQEIQRWIKQRVAQLHGAMEALAIIYFADIVGNDLWLANSEIEKLAYYAKNRAITVEDVKTLCTAKLEENIFLLTDALGQKNKKLAIRLICDQLKQGMTETELLHKCLWHFKNLLIIRSAVDDYGEISSYELAQKLGLHPFVVKKGITQAKNFRFDELKIIFHKLLLIDSAIKTSRIRAEVLFDLLVVSG